MSNAQDPTENALDAIRDVWYAMYDPGDPSMEQAGGEAAWHKQVDEALDELATRIQPHVEEIEKDLMDGQFYME